MLATPVFILSLLAGASARTLVPVEGTEKMDLTQVDLVYQNLFTSFKKTFGKQYADETEHSYRYAVFQENVNRINMHNREVAPTAGWNMNMNQFGDLTPAEFRAKMLQRKGSIIRGREPQVEITDAQPVGNSSYVNWYKQGVVLDVRNQEQCGSCWAFSATGSAASAVSQATGQRPVNPSVQQLVSCAQSTGNQGCNGGSMDLAFKYIIQNGGLETWQSYPYTSGTGNSGTCMAHSPFPAAQIKGYKDVQQGSVKALIAELENGPVSVAVDASQWQFYSGGLFKGCSNTQPDQLDHGVLAVGFDLNDGDDASILVQNSWGAMWGESGFIRLSIGKDENVDMCGVALMASRPHA